MTYSEHEHEFAFAKKCKIRLKGVRKGSHDLLLKFCDPLHISGMGEAGNFKFRVHVEHKGR